MKNPSRLKMRSGVRAPTAESLIEAAKRGDVESILAALDAGADPNAKIVIDDLGGLTNALCEAVTARHGDAVAVLLEHGADPNEFKGAALAFAVQWRELEICRLLLAAGAHRQMAPGDDYYLRDASALRALPIVRLLLEAGAPISAPHIRQRIVTLAEAAGDADLVRLAREAPANLSGDPAG